MKQIKISCPNNSNIEVLTSKIIITIIIQREKEASKKKIIIIIASIKNKIESKTKRSLKTLTKEKKNIKQK